MIKLLFGLKFNLFCHYAVKNLDFMSLCFFKITNFAPNFAVKTATMEQLKHECGVAMVRLLKPLQYYKEKYGTWSKGLDELYLLMEKQHNRGQEGAGVACVKMTSSPGEEYMFRERALGASAIQEIFSKIHHTINEIPSSQRNDLNYVKERVPFAGEIYMGHLRYFM